MASTMGIATMAASDQMVAISDVIALPRLVRYGPARLVEMVGIVASDDDADDRLDVTLAGVLGVRLQAFAQMIGKKHSHLLSGLTHSWHSFAPLA